MKAVLCTKYGTPDVLQISELVKPIPQNDELLIRVSSSSLSVVDSAFRKGDPLVSRLFTGLSKPKYQVPGSIISGIVESIGDQVTRFNVGDEVYGHTSLEFGAWAEYICLNEQTAIVKKPKEMTHLEAAAVAYSAMTALPFLRDHVKILPGSKVLINGASGGIGTFAVQIAKHFGAQVTAVCGNQNIDLVSELGAAVVIDYKQKDFTTALNTYDVIFDVVGKSSYKKCKKALKSGGTYLTTVPDIPNLIHMILSSKKQGRKGKFVATGLIKTPEKIVDLNQLNNLFTTGVIKPVIDRSYGIEDIIEAHIYVDKGHNKGNVVINVQDILK